jgi:hypothetical protein
VLFRSGKRRSQPDRNAKGYGRVEIADVDAVIGTYNVEQAYVE